VSETILIILYLIIKYGCGFKHFFNVVAEARLQCVSLPEAPSELVSVNATATRGPFATTIAKNKLLFHGTSLNLTGVFFFFSIFICLFLFFCSDFTVFVNYNIISETDGEI